MRSDWTRLSFVGIIFLVLATVPFIEGQVFRGGLNLAGFVELRIGRCFEMSSSELIVLRKYSRALDCSFMFTITGPGGYCFYDSQQILVAVDEVGQQDFGWVYPPFACILCSGDWYCTGLSWLHMTRPG